MTGPRRLLPPLAGLTALAALALALPGAARAGFFTSQVAGPDPGIQRAGGIDVATDATGGLAYLGQVGGVDHAFVAPLGTDGAFHAPQQVDGASGAASSPPALAASAGGRLVAVWSQGGDLWGAVRPAGEDAFEHAVLIYDDPADQVANATVDMSINGVAFAVWTASGAGGHDVRAARLQKDRWQVLGDVLDVDPAQDAGAQPGAAPRVAVSADGTGLVVWGEGGHVVARKVFDERTSVAPQDLGIGSDPELDVLDDSSYAWVLFRQGPHVLARRQVGTRFSDPVDLGGGDADPAADQRVRLEGHRDGVAVWERPVSHQVLGAILDGPEVRPPVRLDAGGSSIGAFPAGVLSRNLDGAVVWQSGASADAAQLIGSHIEDEEFEPVMNAGDAALGPVDGALGIFGAADRAGDVAFAYVTGPAGARRVVATVWDRAPGRPDGYTTTHPRSGAHLSWGPAFELWGPVTYEVHVDHELVGETDRTTFDVPDLPDGIHHWRAVAVDQHGQKGRMKRRVLRLDTTRPVVHLSIEGRRRAGAGLRFSVRAEDPAPPGSGGITQLRIAYDHGRDRHARDVTSEETLRTVHAYRRGKHEVVVRARDRAGNVTRVRRTVRIR